MVQTFLTAAPVYNSIPDHRQPKPRERKAGGLPGKCRIDIYGYLIEIVICLMNGILWQPHKFLLLVHDKNVYNCATKNKTGHGSTKTVLLTGELLRLADLSFEQPGTRKST
ncbi:hypothetical protein pipiens_002844 [Culex pipiens pipiens]|uniref:Uncharacterized protein n=1 Tax=Culex pipiens pipiens TaxID=38569 RepID=A0ABD1D793_CULPP